MITTVNEFRKIYENNGNLLQIGDVVKNNSNGKTYIVDNTSDKDYHLMEYVVGKGYTVPSFTPNKILDIKYLDDMILDGTWSKIVEPDDV